MTTYAVIRKIDHAEVYRYTADAPIAWHEMDFTLFDHVIVPDPVAPPAPPPVPPKITKLAFRNRFTQAEKVAIEIASLDVPTAPAAQRSLAAALRANQEDVAVASYIDLGRADTRAGVQTLETYGLVAAGRAAVILDTPPTAEEVWHG